MQLRDQAAWVLLLNGVAGTYKGALPLVDLVQLYIEKTVPWSRAVELTAARYGVSAEKLRTWVRSVAKGMERRNPEGFQKLSSGKAYRLERFVEGLAREVLGQT